MDAWMGTSGAWPRGVLVKLTVAILLLASGLVFPVGPAGGAPGDLAAPSYKDGDWWNYSVNAAYDLPVRVDNFDVKLNDAAGWMHYEVTGTTTRDGLLAWVYNIKGSLTLSGVWTDSVETGQTFLDANVTGTEWRTASDLSYLGSSLRYIGEMEIATRTGPRLFDLDELENRSVDAPLRMLLFPVPTTGFPKEHHTVNITTQYSAEDYQKTRVETLDYDVQFKGIVDAVGDRLTYSNQHHFEVEGNRTVKGTRSSLDGSLYYDAPNRKGLTIDTMKGYEITDFNVELAELHPDLVVLDSEFTTNKSDPTQGDSIFFTAKVHNLGSRELQDIRVELWANTTGGIPSRINTTGVPSIPGKDASEAMFNWTAQEVGVWTFTVRVDPSNYIHEEREDNNEASLNLEVLSFSQRPNLIISSESILVDPASPINNRTAVQLIVRVMNDGRGIAYNVTVNWFLGNPFDGGTQVGWQVTIELIPIGQTRQTFINWVADSPGQHELWCVVDYENSVNETVETDNSAFIPVVVIASPFVGVDLVVEGIGMFDSSNKEAVQLPKGERAQFHVTITNRGPYNASRVHLSIYLDAREPTNLIGSYEGPVQGKLPATVTWAVPWEISADEGPHEIIATVMAIGQIEAAFGDNTEMVEITVGERIKPNPEVLLVTVYPDSTSLMPGQSISVSGKVTRLNTGTDVREAEVEVYFTDTNKRASAKTNENGRYLVFLDVPKKPGPYRLEVSVVEGINSGLSSITVTVRGDDTTPNGGADDENSPLWVFFVTLALLLCLVVAPVSIILFRREQRRRRIKKVHEEIVEIVERKE
jgi:hypothetical protein